MRVQVFGPHQIGQTVFVLTMSGGHVEFACCPMGVHFAAIGAPDLFAHYPQELYGLFVHDQPPNTLRHKDRS